MIQISGIFGLRLRYWWVDDVNLVVEVRAFVLRGETKQKGDTPCSYFRGVWGK
jgi:hypothetical protein